MTTKVTEAVVVAKDKNNQGHRGKGRSLSEVYRCRKGGGGRGQGRVGVIGAEDEANPIARPSM